MIFANFIIPEDEFLIKFVKSSGPGGQNINKLSTKVFLKWNVLQSESLPKAVKERFFDRWSSRLTTKGEVVLSSDKFRVRKKNLDDAFSRLRKMIEMVLVPPKKRKETKPSRSSIEKRIQEKKRRSSTKQNRKKIDYS